MSGEFDIVVAGAGIAGLTAATVAAGLGHRTLILAGGVFGGHLLSIDRIENYPGFPEGVPGYELCPMAQGQAAEAGAEFAMEAVGSLARQEHGLLLCAAGTEYAARAVILATGTSLKKLGVDGEERLFGKGVSQCASCDAPLLRDRPVAVVGGGDSACQEALTLAEAASRVTIFHDRAELAAQKSLAARVSDHPRIDVRGETTVTGIVGDEVVTGIAVTDFAGAAETFAVDAVFVFIGLRPNGDVAVGLAELDAVGAVVTDASLRTSTPGLFAAGTVRAGAAARAVSAAGEGAAAAVAADRFLSDGVWG